MSLPIKHIHQVDEQAIFTTTEELLEELANLGGFNVYEVRGYNDEFEGFVMEVVE